jgi:hypothetical protein
MAKFTLMQQLRLLDRLLSKAEKISDQIEHNLAAKVKKAA